MRAEHAFKQIELGRKTRREENVTETLNRIEDAAYKEEQDSGDFLIYPENVAEFESLGYVLTETPDKRRNGKQTFNISWKQDV